jgi:hypothetical protein
MLSLCSFKISRVGQMSILELWPFGFTDLNRLLSEHPRNGGIFVAVRHPHWRDGFHPPAKKLFSRKVKSQGMVANLKDNSVLVEALNKREFDAVVDLKLFIPKRVVAKKSEIALLQRYFEEFDEAAALKAWGGYWIHIHDACKTYISLPRGSRLLKSFFCGILRTSNAQLERKEISAVYQKLCSLPDSECLLLSWFRDIVRYRVESADVHNYEKVDMLIP